MQVMTDYSRKKLLRYNYSWAHPAEQKSYESYKDNDIIDRNNGFELLDFINRFMGIHGMEADRSFSKLERLIKNYMPADLKTRIEIKMWLRKNWDVRF